MAEVFQRTWKRGRVKKTAWGYTLQVQGKQQKVSNAAWTREDAQQALAERLAHLDDPTRAPGARVPVMTFAQAVTKYLAVKASEGKRSLRDDRQNLARLSTALGREARITDATASWIADYKVARMQTVIPRDGELRSIAPATLNRELASLRHLLNLAHDEWQVLSVLPKIKLLKEPEGRIRWLEPEEEFRLLEACRASHTRHLADVVTVALETGMRKSELLGLTWDRVDLSRGVFRLEGTSRRSGDGTKSKKRRDVPMRQVVDKILAARPEPRQGRVWPVGSIRKAFENAVAVAQIDDFVFHDCRHHFASWYVMRGGSLSSLQKILGHASITMTMKYAHLSPEHLRQEMEKTARSEHSQNMSLEMEPV
jgi:integrase